MLEEKDQKLHSNADEEKKSETTEINTVSEKSTEMPTVNQSASASTEGDLNLKEEEEKEALDSALKETEINSKIATEPTMHNSVESENKSKTTSDQTSDEEENGLEEIDDSNAEDAEDEDNQQRHRIPMLDYHSMPMDNLVGELQRLVKNEKVQAIKKHVENIKYEFDLKFQDFIDQKKEEFLNSGGNEIDFRYNSVDKRQFNEVYTEYREKRNQYYANLEQSLKANLAKRIAIIEDLKGLVSMEEDINTTYKNFKDIQERWRTAGPIPRANYNDVWRTYHHHIEIFYDFLHLNRELRDLDFRHNLEEKEKIVQRAEALAKEEDLSKAFQELQTLHKIWKEDIGPVDKEFRDAIWNRFSDATKVLHLRRQEHSKELDKVFEQNLEKKSEIIAALHAIGSNVATNHKVLQQQIKEVEALREQFFKAGKVPQKVNEQTWAKFKEAMRNFNHGKNSFYKNLKKDQQDNLDKKQALLTIAQSLKDGDDFDVITPEMKRIQNEWKKIGHVPRKYSDKLWNDFKSACNHYFNRINDVKSESHKEESDNLEGKNACLDKLKGYQLTGDKQKDLAFLKTLIDEWKTYGRVPFNQKGINAKFDKILDALFKKLNVNRQQSELLKYGNKIQQLAQAEDGSSIANERTFIRRKIDEIKTELRQLENNLQFFSNASADNPIVKEVVKNIDGQKEALATWKAKLKKLNILENNLIRESETIESQNENLLDEDKE